MKAVVVMFDTLSRRFLSSYGNDWVPTPNFKRLEEKASAFDNFYCGSLPCMPARRELHTGNYNFLHRAWGPIEPYDNSCIELLKNNGIYTHIVTDHSHYWEDGGATYLTRFNSWEGFRGQEGDRWKPIIDKENFEISSLELKNKRPPSIFHNFANRQYQQKEEDLSTVKTMMAGVDFLEKYHNSDNWYLQIESFDPHEPFYVPQKYLDMVNDTYQGEYFDWPNYQMTYGESPEVKEHIQKRYHALIAMCDTYLGKILDVFDKHDMWKDTMLIVNTDHGFLVGEHDWWGKNIPPHYQEISHLPFYLHVPNSEYTPRVEMLTQTIDIAPTLLDYFHIEDTAERQGKSILKALDEGKEIREVALFGSFGSHVNLVTKDYVYMRAGDRDAQLYQYTLMPTNMRGFFSKETLKQAELVETDFTNGIPVLKVPTAKMLDFFKKLPNDTMLFNIKEDPNQLHPLQDSELEAEMADLLIKCMKNAKADEAQFVRLNLKGRD